MDPDVTGLAMSGATVLVQQMVGDGWVQVRDRLARFLTRGSQAGNADAGEDHALRGLQRELDTSRTELLAARDTGDEDAMADVQAEWRSRLRRALRANPELAAELTTLVDEFTPQRQHGNTYNTINGGVYHAPVIQAGVIGNLNPGRPGDRSPGA